MASDTKKPIILSVDDDKQVLRSLRRDLRSAYKQDYRVISTESANEALELSIEFRPPSRPVGIIIPSLTLNY